MSPASPALGRVIAEVYAQVGAPSWAAANLDALADVLRDLSWLPEGEVLISIDRLTAVPSADRTRLLAVLEGSVRESQSGAHPIVLAGPA